MNSSLAASRARGNAQPLPAADGDESRVRRRVGIAWGLLFLNTLTFYAGTWNALPLLVPIPHRIGQIITQGALPAALFVALSVNRRMLLRPNVFLCLLSLLVLDALVASIHPGGHLGTYYRTMRLAGFVGTLWLLTPWWGRRDMLLVKCQLVSLSAVLGSVLLGLVVAPGRALARSRLSGTVWPMAPTEVADYAAVAIGLVIVLWLCGRMRRRLPAVIILAAGPMLLLTHARTELVALLAGILVACLSLFMANARVRKFFAAAGIALSLGVMVFSGLIANWLARGEKKQDLTNLTGRTTVWSAIVKAPRDTFQALFGHGLANKSFNGFPIDSTWLTAYWEVGLLGAGLCATMLLFVLVSAHFQEPSPQRALALFLVTYLLVRSFTETGLSDTSVNLLDLAVAASLLVPAIRDRHRA